MPLPLGHSLLGYGLHRTGRFVISEHAGWNLFWCVLLANAPDLDFLPGFLLGEPNLYHHGISHSVAGALGFALFAAIVAQFWKRKFGPVFITAFVMVSSHLILDLFGYDHRPPVGMALLWPLTDFPFQSPIPLFFKVTRSNDSFSFFPSLLTLANGVAAVWELLFVGSLSGLLVRYGSSAELTSLRESKRVFKASRPG